MEDETRSTDPKNKWSKLLPSEIISAYGSVVQLAIHGQENLWWMLYIFLTFNSIMLLSSAAIFSVSINKHMIYQQIWLLVISAAGFLIDLCWWRMALNYTAASQTYQLNARKLEEILPQEVPKSLYDREQLRTKNRKDGDKDDVSYDKIPLKERAGTMSFVASYMPLLFVTIYGILMCLVLSSFFINACS